MEAPIADCHGQLNRDRRAFSVAVKGIGIHVGSGWQLGNSSAKAPLGKVEIGGDMRLGLGLAIAFEQAQHPLNPHVVGGKLRLQIASAFPWGARVEENEVEHVAVHPFGAHDPHERHAESFLENGLAHGCFRAWHHAADVCVVGNVGHIGDDLRPHEHGGDNGDIGEMRAAAMIRIVGGKHVAGLHVRRCEALAQGLDHSDHRAQMDRDSLG